MSGSIVRVESDSRIEFDRLIEITFARGLTVTKFATSNGTGGINKYTRRRYMFEYRKD